MSSTPRTRRNSVTAAAENAKADRDDADAINERANPTPVAVDGVLGTVGITVAPSRYRMRVGVWNVQDCGSGPSGRWAGGTEPPDVTDQNRADVLRDYDQWLATAPEDDLVQRDLALKKLKATPDLTKDKLRQRRYASWYRRVERLEAHCKAINADVLVILEVQLNGQRTGKPKIDLVEIAGIMWILWENTLGDQEFDVPTLEHILNYLLRFERHEMKNPSLGGTVEAQAFRDATTREMSEAWKADKAVPQSIAQLRAFLKSALFSKPKPASSADVSMIDVGEEVVKDQAACLEQLDEWLFGQEVDARIEDDADEVKTSATKRKQSPDTMSDYAGAKWSRLLTKLRRIRQTDDNCPAYDVPGDDKGLGRSIFKILETAGQENKAKWVLLEKETPVAGRPPYKKDGETIMVRLGPNWASAAVEIRRSGLTADERPAFKVFVRDPTSTQYIGLVAVHAPAPARIARSQAWFENLRKLTNSNLDLGGRCVLMGDFNTGQTQLDTCSFLPTFFSQYHPPQSVHQGIHTSAKMVAKGRKTTSNMWSEAYDKILVPKKSHSVSVWTRSAMNTQKESDAAPAVSVADEYRRGRHWQNQGELRRYSDHTYVYSDLWLLAPDGTSDESKWLSIDHKNKPPAIDADASGPPGTALLPVSGTSAANDASGDVVMDASADANTDVNANADANANASVKRPKKRTKR